MMPILSIEPGNGVPPYEQLRQQLTTAIRDGDLAPGTTLPTVRRLAADLGVAPNTVARTYQELERQGMVETQGRRGTLVAERAAGEDALRRAAADYADLARRQRMNPATALALVRDAIGMSEARDVG